MKESEDEILKKIAHAEAVNKGIEKQPMGTVKRNNQREMIENLRNPGKMNALTY